MKLGTLLISVAAALALVGATLRPTSAEANGSSCGSGTSGSSGYAYAGHQAESISHGVRATISTRVSPTVTAGHVAGWIGVGGPGQGPNGETMWLQSGIAAIPGSAPMVYVEITRPGSSPLFISLRTEVEVARSYSLAVLEMSHRPDYWRIWLNNQPVTEPIHLPGSTDLWRPIVTAESWNGGTGACNQFGFRFENVGIATSKGGSWRAFKPGHQFLDRGFTVRELKTADDGQRTLSGKGIKPYAFEAASAS